jgi:hypothetical protein
MKNFRDAALSVALTLGLLLGFVCLAVWWMQTNFGAISALATVGGVVMATVLYVGVRIGGNLVRDSQRTALENFTDGLASVEQTRTASARGQNAAQTAQAKITVLDYKYQLQQQAQQQRMLTDARRSWEVEQQARQQPQPAGIFAMVDSDGGEAAMYE